MKERPAWTTLLCAAILGVILGAVLGLTPLIRCSRCRGQGQYVVGYDGSGLLRPTATGLEWPAIRSILHSCDDCSGKGRLPLWSQKCEWVMVLHNASGAAECLRQEAKQHN